MGSNEAFEAGYFRTIGEAQALKDIQEAEDAAGARRQYLTALTIVGIVSLCCIACFIVPLLAGQ